MEESSYFGLMIEDWRLRVQTTSQVATFSEAPWNSKVSTLFKLPDSEVWLKQQSKHLVQASGIRSLAGSRASGC